MAQRGLILDTGASLSTILTSDPGDIGRLAANVRGVQVRSV
jgi:hypothetical protein